MRYITKGQEPPELGVWRRQHQNACYRDLDTSPTGKTIRQDIRQAALKEQFYLCAYCCKTIDDTNSNNEHIASQHTTPRQSLDFNNIVASCTTPARCNQARGHQALPLTPLMPECESELKFYLSGKVIGNTARATEAIKVLALDSAALRGARKQLLDALLYDEGLTTEDLKPPPDDEILAMVLVSLQAPDTDGKLLAFSPALTNIIKHLLANR
jgi:uncharacterized protein (TIGR02646 family)